MHKIELFYFGDCPNIENARSAILAAGVHDLIEVIQEELDANDFRRRYSSPTILFNGEIIAGALNGSMACSIVTWKSVSVELEKRIADNHDLAE